jgi:hypothetical protein
LLPEECILCGILASTVKYQELGNNSECLLPQVCHPYDITVNREIFAVLKVGEFFQLAVDKYRELGNNRDTPLPKKKPRKHSCLSLVVEKARDSSTHFCFSTHYLYAIIISTNTTSKFWVQPSTPSSCHCIKKLRMWIISTLSHNATPWP